MNSTATSAFINICFIIQGNLEFLSMDNVSTYIHEPVPTYKCVIQATRTADCELMFRFEGFVNIAQISQIQSLNTYFSGQSEENFVHHRKCAMSTYLRK